jgi:predicted fused transcriptional regulator/phosphomethylpyrimidine kinase
VSVKATIAKALRELERAKHPARMAPGTQQRLATAPRQKKSLVEMTEVESLPGRIVAAHFGAGGLGAGLAIREKQRKSRRK